MDPAVGRPRFGSRRRPGKKNRNIQGGGGSLSYNELGQREVFVTPPLTVGEFASACGVPVTEVIKRVMMMGEVLNINAHMSEELMELIAPELNVELTIEKVGDEFDIEDYLPEIDENRMIRRAPVVTIMGHVDHGKTSLLDYIRRTKVAEGEFGGITQHIGAYHVSTPKGDIVFLDTPGHEAFTSMRARGAQITDIVILVVAANDGFKPQTIEAMNHALAAKVPIVVAVNKVDLPDADPMKVRQEALKYGLIPEELGGEYMFIDVSAKKGTNVDALLESVALQAEILDLKADPGTNAMGLVIESHVDPNRGAVATILIENGTLRIGDDFVCGDVYGRVRAMLNDRGVEIEEAGPSTPVEILGLSDSPSAGEVFLVVPDEHIARGIAEKRAERRRLKALSPVTHRHMTLETLHEHLKEGETKSLNVILKADVQGSIEAISQSLEKLSNDQIRIRILHSAVGGVTENDVNLAAASDAIIFGFNVRPDARTEAAAQAEGIEIKTYRIIYDLLEDVKAAMAGLLAPTKREKILGHAEVLQLFRISRVGTVAGCVVRDGEIVRSAKIRLLRGGVVVYEGQLASLKRLKDDVRKVTSGLECGISIENYNDIKEGDIIEAYEIEEVAGELVLNSGQYD
jgi:translation initiation factor IF-2